MTSKQIFLTGATGLVGRRVAKDLCERGHQVSILTRRGADDSALQGLPLERVEGDLANPSSFAEALKKAEIVIHAAAHIGDWGPAEQYREINVLALEKMLGIVESGDRLQRWIQISSLGVYPARHHYGTDETLPPSLRGLDGYTKTKAEAEVVLQQHRERRGLPVVILRPGFIYGPGERHSLPRVIEKLQAGKMKYIGRGDKLLNNTYVGNFSDAVMIALDHPKAIGETFNIRDKRLVTREEYINTIADYLGKPHPGHVPEWLARSLVKPIETLAKLRGAKEAPLLTEARIKFMTLNLDFSIAKAERILGYQPRVDFREGMQIALEDAMGKKRA